jgi:beta-lactamase class D
MRNWIICILWVLAGAARGDVILIRDIPGQDMRILGKVEEADRAFSPASTFKMVVALTAFEQGIATPATQAECNDRFLPSRPMRLAFREAMQHSSNEFFQPLFRRLTPEQLVEMGTRCGFGTAPASKRPPVEEFRHGGIFRITPRQQQDFMKRLALGELPVSWRVQTDLLSVMEWPLGPAEKGHAYGKTGSWEKVYWFTGMRRHSGGVRLVTVLLTAADATREKAIAAFLQHSEPPE